MNKIVIEGDKIKNVNDFHNIIAQVPDVPEYYGRNLYALYDVLTTLERPLILRWQNSGTSKNILGRKFDDLVNVFSEVEKFDIENNRPNRFTFILD